MRGGHEPGKTGEEAGCRILMKANGLRWFASVKEVGAMDEIIDEWDGESFFCSWKRINHPNVESKDSEPMN